MPEYDPFQTPFGYTSRPATTPTRSTPKKRSDKVNKVMKEKQAYEENYQKGFTSNNTNKSYRSGGGTFGDSSVKNRAAKLKAQAALQNSRERRLKYKNAKESAENSRTNTKSYMRGIRNGNYNVGATGTREKAQMSADTQKAIRQSAKRRANSNSGVYVVKRNDNLTKIAKTHGTTLAAILKNNPRLRSHPNLIWRGTRVKL